MSETRLNPRISIGGTHRVGSFYADRSALIEALGEPHETGGDKTTMEWFFETPAGPATLYDYWWNREGEWSIGGCSEETAEHLVKHLNSLLGR